MSKQKLETAEVTILEWGTHSMRLEENHDRTTTVTILIDKGEAGKCSDCCIVPTLPSKIADAWENAEGWQRSLEVNEDEFFALAHLYVSGLGYLVMSVNHDHSHPEDTITFHRSHHG